MNIVLRESPDGLYPFILADLAELLTIQNQGVLSQERWLQWLNEQDQYTGQDPQFLWDKLIEHCQFRVDIYRIQYPFKVDVAQKEIRFTFIKTQPQQRLYLSLLLAANRSVLPEESNDEITDGFAITCHQLFKHLMPQGVRVQRLPLVVDQFPPYEQTAYMAKVSRGITLLQEGDFLGRESLILNDEERKDGIKAGIVDILAWHTMGDERDGIPVALGRCDCESENWLMGQQTLSNLDTHFYTRHAFAKYHFSPIDLLTKEMEWALKERLGRVIFLDRYRIMALAEEYFIYDDLPDWDVIDLHCKP